MKKTIALIFILIGSIFSQNCIAQTEEDVYIGIFKSSNEVEARAISSKTVQPSKVIRVHESNEWVVGLGPYNSVERSKIVANEIANNYKKSTGQEFGYSIIRFRKNTKDFELSSNNVIKDNQPQAIAKTDKTTNDNSGNSALNIKLSESKKRLAEIRGKSIKLNNPAGEWFLYTVGTNRSETYFEKIQPSNKNIKAIRIIEYTDKFFNYPIYIASKRAGSVARANAIVNYYEVNCLDYSYHNKKVHYFSGSIKSLNDLISYVENDKIFDYNAIFMDLAREFGVYVIDSKTDKYWLDFYASACLN